MVSIKKLMSAALSVALAASIIGCASTANNGGQATDEPEQAETSQAKDYTTGTPWQDIDLDGVVTKDTPTDVKDNYALYVNKDKVLDLEIPPGYPCGGTFVDSYLKRDEDIRALFTDNKLSESDSHDTKLALSLYQLMTDWDGRNAAGVTPLKKQVDAIEAIDSLESLTEYQVDVPVESQIGKFWSYKVEQSLEDSNRYLLKLESPQLLLEDSAEYTELTDYGSMKKEAKTELAHKMLVKLGYTEDEANAKVDNCLAFEKTLASAIPTSQEQQHPDYDKNSNNHVTRSELKAMQKQVPILQVLEESMGFAKSDDYIVKEPDYFTKLAEVYTDENLELMRDFLIVQGVIDTSGSLDRECYEWRNDCRNAMTGATGVRDDETVFSGAVADILCWPVARMYADTYLKQEDKERITSVAEELLDYYHEILKEADFFTEETRAKALEKLDAIDVNVLYPDSWDEYSYQDLNFASSDEGGTLWDAKQSIAAFKIAQDVAKYAKPVDKTRWEDEMAPQVVNCFYNPQSNSIYILGAFAQSTIYNSDMSDEEVYAKIGAVVGHEISHAFDSSGSQYDKDGNMVNWWTDKDSETFQARNKKLADYYNAMHPWEGQNFKGDIMTGEACADMAGIRAVLGVVSQKENFDYDAFFSAFADLYLIKDTLPMAYRRINDVHPMCYLRINGTLQQYDEFLDFYGIKEGDTMYLAPEDRVAIW